MINLPTSPLGGARFYRGEYHLGKWTVVSEWQEAGFEYMLVATHTPERDLKIVKYNDIREMWEEVKTPVGFRYLVEREGDRMMVPMESINR